MEKHLITLDGKVKNSGVPLKIVKQAIEWIMKNQAVIELEWQKMNNPCKK